jgi:hypothetical protein
LAAHRESLNFKGFSQSPINHPPDPGTHLKVDEAEAEAEKELADLELPDVPQEAPREAPAKKKKEKEGERVAVLAA